MTKEQDERITALMNTCGPRLKTLAYHITGSNTLAEDLVQDAFVLLCQNTDILSQHENLPGWLYKTVRFLALREMKRAYHKRNVPLDPEAIPAASGIDLPMENYLPRGLKPKEREIILLRVDQGLDYDEIAARKGKTAETCRQSFSRAARKCRKLFQTETPLTAGQE